MSVLVRVVAIIAALGFVIQACIAAAMAHDEATSSTWRCQPDRAGVAILITMATLFLALGLGLGSTAVLT